MTTNHSEEKKAGVIGGFSPEFEKWTAACKVELEKARRNQKSNQELELWEQFARCTSLSAVYELLQKLAKKRFVFRHIQKILPDTTAVQQLATFEALFEYMLDGETKEFFKHFSEVTQNEPSKITDIDFVASATFSLFIEARYTVLYKPEDLCSAWLKIEKIIGTTLISQNQEKFTKHRLHLKNLTTLLSAGKTKEALKYLNNFGANISRFCNFDILVLDHVISIAKKEYPLYSWMLIVPANLQVLYKKVGLY